MVDCKTAVVAAVLLWGCVSVPPDAPEAGRSPVAEALIASLDVRVHGDTAELGLHVTNASAEAVVAAFATAQRYDFAVLTPDGREVWRWSADRAFAQATGEESVPAGGWLQYREQWPGAGRRGRYIAEARLTSTNRPIVLRTEFEVPAP
jgi:hypothetical protein